LQVGPTKDAQSVFKDLNSLYNSGVTANLNAQTLEMELIGMKIDNKYKNGCEHFLNLWTTKLMDLENVRVSEIPDSQNNFFPNNAVMNHSKLADAIFYATILEHHISNTGESTDMELSFPQYFNMILSNAKRIDFNLGEQAKYNNTSRQVNQAQASTTSQTRKKTYRDKWHVEPEKWKAMTKAQKDDHKEKAKKARA
jgi:DNA polymerase III epsilon subunit-like protein